MIRSPYKGIYSVGLQGAAGAPSPLNFHLRENEREQHLARLPKDTNAGKKRQRNLVQRRLENQQPNRQQGDSEKVIEQHKWLPYDAGQKTNGTVDTLATALEIAEAAELESFQLRV